VPSKGWGEGGRRASDQKGLDSTTGVGERPFLQKNDSSGKRGGGGGGTVIANLDIQSL